MLLYAPKCSRRFVGFGKTSIGGIREDDPALAGIVENRLGIPDRVIFTFRVTRSIGATWPARTGYEGIIAPIHVHCIGLAGRGLHKAAQLRVDALKRPGRKYPSSMAASRRCPHGPMSILTGAVKFT